MCPLASNQCVPSTGGSSRTGRKRASQAHKVIWLVCWAGHLALLRQPSCGRNLCRRSWATVVCCRRLLCHQHRPPPIAQRSGTTLSLGDLCRIRVPLSTDADAVSCLPRLPLPCATGRAFTPPPFPALIPSLLPLHLLLPLHRRLRAFSRGLCIIFHPQLPGAPCPSLALHQSFAYKPFILVLRCWPAFLAQDSSLRNPHN